MVDVDLASKRSVGLELGRSRAADRVHLVIAVPIERDGSAITPVGGLVSESPGDTPEGELTAAGLEKDVGRLDHVGIVVLVAGQLDDPPLAQDAHARAQSSFGRRTKL